jgi:hypothetical protein
MHKDSCWTIHEPTGTARISYGVCQEKLTKDLNMNHSVMEFVPKLLINDHKLGEKANEPIVILHCFYIENETEGMAF